MAEAEDIHATEESHLVEELQPDQEQVDQHQEEPPKNEDKPNDVEQAAGEAAQPEPAAADAIADEGTEAAEDKADSRAAAVTQPTKEASEQDHVAAAEEDAVVHKPAHAEVQHTAAEVQHTASAQGVQEDVKEEEQQQQDDEQAAEQEQHAHVQVQHNTSPTRVQETRKVAHSVAASQCGPFSQTAADGRLLSFSAPPYVPKAKPYRRVDYSHSAVQLMKIAHDNQLLVNHLKTISKAVPAWTKDASAPPAPGNTASSAVNRRKQAAVIAQENHALYQRLVAIRPSKDISREMLEAEHRQKELYRANCAQFKSPGSPKAKAVSASP